ncbi:hypothetical protein SSP24_24160 [Streptomyces spinoverrucosus]|uniref:Uncharacterized protein n=1 Tax=Streptomyces spinoverrucosus TaxID=284043 RepID=A0A4Y3VGM3_9ACTN|nr:hypothetical protein SSP24_24160 [Streptomyces spinoverrucosus]GHB59494.1 hypothetical protein GCM10010397_32000 [Streptomyces spinoverrucosus]
MEICIAVADWARGLMTWVLDAPGGEGTGATRRNLPTHVRHRVCRVSPSGSTDSGRGAGMVVGWG